MKAIRLFSIVAGTALAAVAVQGAQTAKPDSRQIARGRYLAIVGNCNDCHTAGYAPSEGKVTEKEWLKGDTLGFAGPWGTTYPTNLRLALSKMSEDQWVQYARSFKTRPPMPWFTVNQWSEADLRAFHKYVIHLGAPGVAAPQALPPRQKPTIPYIQWVLPPKKP